MRKHHLTIALDGPDGVGKTTQLELLRDYLKDQGLDVHTTRASGGTPIGEALRQVSLSEHPRSAETDLHISFAMYTALAEALGEWRQQGKSILIDRSPLAMVAYNAYGSQLADKQRVLQACADYIRAWQIDVLVFLHADQRVLDDRRLRRQKASDYFEKQGATYYRRVHEGYQAALEYLESKADLATQIIKIDASPDVQTVQKSLREIISAL